MKTLRYVGVTLGAVVAGLLVWRKIESDRLQNDLWAEAERRTEEDLAQADPVHNSEQRVPEFVRSR